MTKPPTKKPLLSGTVADKLFGWLAKGAALLTLALLITRRSRAVVALFAVEVFNAAIGFVQYFTHLPVMLVGIHMLGAALVAAASTWVLLDE